MTLDRLQDAYIIGYFNHPYPLENHATVALNVCNELVSFWEKMDETPIRVTVCSGTVLAGNFGCNDFLNHTLIGNPYHLARYLLFEYCDKETPSIVVDQHTRDLLEDPSRLDPIDETKFGNKKVILYSPKI